MDQEASVSVSYRRVISALQGGLHASVTVYSRTETALLASGLHFCAFR